MLSYPIRKNAKIQIFAAAVLQREYNLTLESITYDCLGVLDIV